MRNSPISRIFQSTLPARGATTDTAKSGGNCTHISIHAPRTGSDGIKTPIPSVTGGFQSTLPARGATNEVEAILMPAMQFQSTLPARGATAHARKEDTMKQFQSTLPARGATPSGSREPAGRKHFNPRSPHGERRDTKRITKRRDDFNPRSPHGERPERVAEILCISKISIHAPRTGSDAFRSIRSLGVMNFNPRSPHGERRVSPFESRSASNFNPRSPHGERQRWRTYFTLPIGFQSTLPARGATRARGTQVAEMTISIHAPRTGSDDDSIFDSVSISSFQSTLPARGATVGNAEEVSDFPISIHAPRTGSDTFFGYPSGISKRISIHAPRTGSDSAK